MEIRELKSVPRSRDRIEITLEDGSRLRVGVNEVADWSLYVGRDLTDGEVARLKGDVRVREFLSKAMNVLSRRRQSRQEIAKRLDGWGANGEEIEAVCSRLDDADYAAEIVRYYGAKGYGIRRLRDELYRRGVPRDLWDDALEKREDPTEKLDALVQKKMRGAPPERDSLRKLSDFLSRRGYSWGEVREAVRRYEETYEYGDEDEDEDGE